MSRSDSLNLVIDSSAFIGGFSLEDDDYFTVPEVIDEILDEVSKERLLYFINSGKILVREPKENTVKEVIKKSETTADSLSVTDLKLISLALDMDSVILTDDYGIQNLASTLGVKCESIREAGIQKLINWEYYCMGCKKIYPKGKKDCDDCGSPIKRRPKS